MIKGKIEVDFSIIKKFDEKLIHTINKLIFKNKSAKEIIEILTEFYNKDFNSYEIKRYLVEISFLDLEIFEQMDILLAVLVMCQRKCSKTILRTKVKVVTANVKGIQV